MARKNLLKGLMDEAAKTDSIPAVRDEKQAALPRYSKGAIGAVGQSIAELKSRSVNEIDCGLIDWGGNTDRLDDDPADHAALVASIQEYGQQVPVLLRPNPTAAGRFQVVYGRRRIRALKELGIPAKALVRDMDDAALIMAQGQENSARKDLSFIERANFARQMRDANYDRKAICDALHVDKTVISRMLSVADQIPVEAIEVIGPAPSAGRDRWGAFAAAFKQAEWDATDAIQMISVLAPEASSDERFQRLHDHLMNRDKPKSPVSPPKVPVQSLQGHDGKEIGKFTVSNTRTVLTFKQGSGFDDWLVEQLPEIYRTWRERGDK